MAFQRYLVGILVVLIIIAGVGGYFAGSSAVPPTRTVTSVVTQTVTTTTTATITKTVTAVPTEVKPITWKMSTFLPTGDPRYKLTLYFAELVKNLSNGRLVIEVHPGGELFPIAQTLDAVAKGVVEIAEITIAYWAAENPVFALATNKPGPLTSPFEALYEMNSVLDIFKKHLEARGVIYLGPIDYSAPEILMCRAPLKSLDELRGKLVRTAGLSAAFYEALGAKAVTIMPAEVYMALQLGTVDCAELGSFAVNLGYGLHEVARYVIKPSPGIGLHSQALLEEHIIVNPQAWTNLPEDLKTILQAAREATLVKALYELHRLNLEAEGEYIKAGATIRILSPEEEIKVRAAAVKVYVGYAAKSSDALEMAKRFVKLWKDLGYESWSAELEKELRTQGLIK